MCGCRWPPPSFPPFPSLILSALPQPHYAALICFTSDIQGKTLAAACVDYTLQDHDRSAKNIGVGMVGILNLNEADNNIEVHGGMESAGRGREGGSLRAAAHQFG